ncbi:hypothetical protein BRD19_04410 [Halobacteriales archaeon SW_7_65_23]|nr:MAG: hypothetical protein BRD19_04410 [Halobacteriales archaeon SW_7_65_23]
MSDGNLGVQGWLEQVFFGGMELSVLSTPAFIVLIVAQRVYPDAVPIAGLQAIAAGSIAIAAFRNEAVDVGTWPRRSELTSLPLRLVYFSAVFFLATMGVAHAVHTAGSWWLVLLGSVVQVVGLAGFPTAYQLVHGDPVLKPVERV